MRSALLLLVVMSVSSLVAMELVDDPIYRHMTARLEERTDRTPEDDFRLAGLYADARAYAKGEALYLKYLSIAERYPLIYANLSVYAGKQGKHAEAIAWADKAISACDRIVAQQPDVPFTRMHPTLVKASWLWESGKQAEATALFASVPVPAPGDAEESTYWGCRACFYGSVGNQAELRTAIATCLALADQHFVTFVRRDIVFDRYRAEPWFIELVGVTIRP